MLNAKKSTQNTSEWVKFDRNGGRFVDPKTALASMEVRKLIDDFKSVDVSPPTVRDSSNPSKRSKATS